MSDIKNNIGWKKQVDKLIFIFACIYLTMTLAWLWKQKQSVSLLSQTSQNEENQTTTNSSNNNNSKPSKNEVVNNFPPQNGNLNPVNNPPILTLTPSIPLPVLEKVSQNNSPNQSSEIALPPPPPLNETIVNAQPITQPKSPIPYVKPSPVTPPPKLNTVPTLDTLKSITTQETAINTVPSPSTSEITEELNNVKYDYTLIGVVQLPNNKSFALFKNNNLTEKVSVGKEIGTSGWVLMAINEQQAVISYQNESKNLRVGEKF